MKTLLLQLVNLSFVIFLNTAMAGEHVSDRHLDFNFTDETQNEDTASNDPVFNEFFLSN
jgi:hypothetical protein